MMTTVYRRAHNNFVNLGRLYSVPPWGTVPIYGLTKPQNNFVNLGNLYAHTKNRKPPGWAYFDDGSVFIAPYGWFPHDVFERRMKIAARFVSDPTPKLQETRRENPHKKRFIIINKNGKELFENTFHILARNAQDGQRVQVTDPPFQAVALSLDPTGNHPVSARFQDAPQLKYEHRVRSTEALETFRGTLVDGVLQPNVRLGNGLGLSDKPTILKPQVQEKRRTRNYEARKLREEVGLPPRAPAKLLDRLGVRSPRDRPSPPRFDRPQPPRFDRPTPVQDRDLERREAQVAQRERELIQLQQQLLLQTMRNQNTRPHRERVSQYPPRDNTYSREHRTPASARAPTATKSDPKTADIEARERALEQREELLRFKRKTWILEQKLAQATGRPPPAQEAYEGDVDAPKRTSQPPYEPPSRRVAATEPEHRSSGDDFPSTDFDLDASPPEALKTLRSRIQLPSRRILRSDRVPRPR
ncbi:hypothetical protein EJ02DRAFT_365678 [Clathrospora elynae]|uniref:Uncharacterized protein n=1 Tax=Clathrospora elynae TaxID=706981 RepID=A0A6A5T596_9PLEO|nr:hypothetical protein EJ02DRAFT_365678 [Clathrospora elynae]